MTRLSLSAAALALVLASPARADGTGYIGEVMTVGFGYCPAGWADANGRLMVIAQNQPLFSLFGMQFGGDGRVTFNLPDLRGRVTAGQGADFQVGRVAPVVDPMAINKFDVPRPPELHKSQPLLALRYCVSLNGQYPTRP